MIVVFDVGKTNKKILIFDEQYRVVQERQESWAEIADEDGFSCDDLRRLTQWVRSEWEQLQTQSDFPITAVNVAAYGASLVHLDAQDRPLTPLYSYLKPFPEALQAHFDTTYGPAVQFATDTCSPPMGMLNSGLQLYWLKYARTTVFKQLKLSLHLPQYLNFLISGRKISDFTSVGCHTALWDVQKNTYHRWVAEERLERRLAPIETFNIERDGITYGTGLHDSSAVIMAYLKQCEGVFMVISTGTWCIAMNPFNTDPFTAQDLRQDCLAYLTDSGRPVKAARLFLGREHDHQVGRLAAHFAVQPDYFRSIGYDAALVTQVEANPHPLQPACLHGTGPFPDVPSGVWELAQFDTPEIAYHQLLVDLIKMLTVSIGLVDTPAAQTIYMDGGFARNELFTILLARLLPHKKIVISEVPQATSLGAALVVGPPNPVVDWSFRSV